MLYRETIAVCSECHIKHINTLCGQNVGLFNAWWHIKYPQAFKRLNYAMVPFPHHLQAICIFLRAARNGQYTARGNL
jgi:hypothetical protein